MRTAWPALRLILLVDGLVFLAAALMNFGVHLLVLSFAAPIWQAGTGEAVIAAVLLAAAFSARRGLDRLLVVGAGHRLRSQLPGRSWRRPKHSPPASAAGSGAAGFTARQPR